MDAAYQEWLADSTPENLNKVVEAANPMITSEIHRYPGPKTLLRSQARLLAAKAVKTYDPTKGAALRSWMVTQMQPLIRYSNTLKPMKMSEDMGRKSAELNTVSQQLSQELGRNPTDEELADHIGISVPKINKIRSQVKPVMVESAFDNPEDESMHEPAVQHVSNIGLADEAVYMSLNDRHKAIYDYKTGSHGTKPLSNQEIAKRMGISPAAISQITNDISTRILRATQNVI